MAKNDKYVWYNEFNKISTSELKEMKANFLKLPELPISEYYLTKINIILTDRAII